MNQERRYAEPAPSGVADIVHALAENIRSILRVLRPIFGWFIVSVFICGTPRVLEISIGGIRQGYLGVKCAVVGCPAINNAQYTTKELMEMTIAAIEEEQPDMMASIKIVPRK